MSTKEKLQAILSVALGCGVVGGCPLTIGTCLYRESRPYTAVEPEGRAAIEQTLDQKLGEQFVVPTAYTISTTPITQVFRDHRGWRVYTTDADGKLDEISLHEWGFGYRAVLPLIPEIKSFNGLGHANAPVLIYKDLEQGTQPYMRRVDFTFRAPGFVADENVQSSYTEIHLPKDGKLSAGIDEFGGKYREHEPMKEIGG